MFCFCSFLACVSLCPSLCLPFSCLLSCAPSVDVPLSLLCRVTSCSGLLVPLCAFPRLAAVPSSPPSRDVLAWFSEFFADVSSRVSGCFLSVPYLVILSCSLPVWCSGSPGFPVFRASHGNKGFGPVVGLCPLHHAASVVRVPGVPVLSRPASVVWPCASITVCR